MAQPAQPPLNPVMRILVILTGTYSVGFVGLEGMILGVQNHGIPLDWPLWAPSPGFLAIVMVVQCGLAAYLTIVTPAWKACLPTWVFIALSSVWLWITFQINPRATAWVLALMVADTIWNGLIGFKSGKVRIRFLLAGFYALAFCAFGFTVLHQK